MMDPKRIRLYLVTDPGMTAPEAFLDTVSAAVRGGVTIVQLRDKPANTRSMLETGRALKAILDPLDVPLIINDRVDVALALGASGVHLGQSDLPTEEARRLMGEDAIIGLSTHSPAEALAAKAVSYIASGPIHPTPTKTDTGPALGMDGFAEVGKVVQKPLVGIGQVNVSNAARVIGLGASGVAVVSAIMKATAPEQAARELRQVIDKALEEAGR